MLETEHYNRIKMNSSLTKMKETLMAMQKHDDRNIKLHLLSQVRDAIHSSNQSLMLSWLRLASMYLCGFQKNTNQIVRMLWSYWNWNPNPFAVNFLPQRSSFRCHFWLISQYYSGMFFFNLPVAPQEILKPLPCFPYSHLQHWVGHWKIPGPLH